MSQMEFADVLAAIEGGEVQRITSWLEEPDVDVDWDVDEEFGSSALQWACHWGKLDIVQAILMKRGNPNHQNVFDGTPLHWACKNGSKVCQTNPPRWSVARTHEGTRAMRYAALRYVCTPCSHVFA